MERLLDAMTILSIVLMIVILYSVRRSHIRVEYSVSWLAAAIILLVLSRSPAAFDWIAAQLGLTYPPLALMMLVFWGGIALAIVFLVRSLGGSRPRQSDSAMDTLRRRLAAGEITTEDFERISKVLQG